MNKRHASSYLMLIGSMLIFGTIGIFRRFIPLSSALLACTRGLLGTLVLLIFLMFRRRSVRGLMGMRKILPIILAGGLMGANWMLLFEAYRYTTVAAATLCYYMEPAIVILLSPLLFKERLSPLKLVCAVVSIAGMALVSGITDGQSVQTADLRGILFGLGAAALYAAVVILNKKVQVDDVCGKTVIQLLSAAVVLLPYVLLTEDPGSISLTPFSAAMVLVVGIVHTGIAYMLYFGSINALPAQSVAVLSYLDPVSALIISAIVLREGLSPWGIIGAVLIIGSSVVCETFGRNSKITDKEKQV